MESSLFMSSWTNHHVKPSYANWPDVRSGPHKLTSTRAPANELALASSANVGTVTELDQRAHIRRAQPRSSSNKRSSTSKLVLDWRVQRGSSPMRAPASVSSPMRAPASLSSTVKHTEARELAYGSSNIRELALASSPVQAPTSRELTHVSSSLLELNHASSLMQVCPWELAHVSSPYVRSNTADSHLVSP